MIIDLYEQIEHTPDIDCIYPHWLQTSDTARAYRAGLLDGCEQFPHRPRLLTEAMQDAYNRGFADGAIWYMPLHTVKMYSTRRYNTGA